VILLKEVEVGLKFILENYFKCSYLSLKL
jgi:hypothetical protein